MRKVFEKILDITGALAICMLVAGVWAIAVAFVMIVTNGVVDVYFPS